MQKVQSSSSSSSVSRNRIQPLVGIENFCRRPVKQKLSGQHTLTQFSLVQQSSCEKSHTLSSQTLGSRSRDEGYWTARLSKLSKQLPCGEGVYERVSGVLCNKQKQLLESDESEHCWNKKKKLFEGLVFYFNGRMDAENACIRSQYHLTRLAALHGAQVLPFFAKKRTTHTICVNLCGSKAEQVRNEGVRAAHIWYVSPKWIEDCIASNQLLQEEKYLVVHRSGFNSIKKFMEVTK